MKSKSKFLAFVIAVFSITFASTSLQAQVKQATPTKSGEWTLLKSSDNVSVSYKIGFAGGSQVIVIKIINSSAEQKNVSFSLWNNPRAVIVKAGQTVEGLTESDSSRQLMLGVPAGQTAESMNAQIKITPTN